MTLRASYADRVQALFWTRPLLRQRVQTRMRLMPPPAAARTSCKLGFQRRLVLLLAWLTLLPTDGRLPQIAQCLIAQFFLVHSAASSWTTDFPT
jgi:hypothetical protein